MAMIGIRLADGRFFPILDEEQPAKKRLILTTVKDDQPSVQIDVYRADDETGLGKTYVGSLVIENIPPRPRGEPDVRLELGLDADGNLSAFAQEEASGEHQTLSVSLKALGEEEKYEIPDFDFQEDETLSLGTDEFPDMNPFDSTDADIEAHSDADEPVGTRARDSLAVKAAAYAPKRADPDFAADETPAEQRKPSKLISILLALAALGLVLAISFLVFKCVNERQPDPPAPVVSQAPAPVVVAPPAPAPMPLPAPTPPPVAETAPVAPPAEATSAKPAKEPGVWYKIRWGDTLWDLSMAYYRNPWLYGKISRYNKIKNPDLIISGTWIYIPKP